MTLPRACYFTHTCMYRQRDCLIAVLLITGLLRVLVKKPQRAMVPAKLSLPPCLPTASHFPSLLPLSLLHFTPPYHPVEGTARLGPPHYLIWLISHAAKHQQGCLSVRSHFNIIINNGLSINSCVFHAAAQRGGAE